MIYLGNWIEQSDQHDESYYVNFSTMNMVMTLFGRWQRRQWLPFKNDTKHINTQHHDHHHPALQSKTSMMNVVPIAIAIAVLTGISEEVVFHGEIPSLYIISMVQ